MSDPIDLSPIMEARNRALVAVLNACPDATEEDAEEVINSIATLIFTTMNTYIEEKQNESNASH